MKPCPYCSEEILDTAIKCKHCGEFLDKPRQTTNVEPVAKVSNPKNPGVALLLSLLFPGLGQFYNEQVGKGIAFIICFLALLITVIGAVIVWLIGATDALNSAREFNRLSMLSPADYEAEMIKRKASDRADRVNLLGGVAIMVMCLLLLDKWDSIAKAFHRLTADKKVIYLEK